MEIPPSPVRVEYLKNIQGFIPIRVCSEDQSVTFYASDCFDPLPDMIKWLEAITTGVQSCSFRLDEEGTEKRLVVVNDYRITRLTIVNELATEEVFLEAVVDPVELVGQFYNNLQNYAQTSGYRKDLWEQDTLLDICCEFFGHQNEDLISNKLLGMNRIELEHFLFAIDPGYRVTFPDIQDNQERVHMECFYCFRPVEGLAKGGVVEPLELKLSEKYDLVSRRRKKRLLYRFLTSPRGSKRGSKLTQVRSSVIEQWLTKMRLQEGA